MNANLIITAKNVQDASNLDDQLIALREYHMACAAGHDQDDLDAAETLADTARLATWGVIYLGDNDNVISHDDTRMLLASDNPHHVGYIIVDRDDIIFPAGGWRYDRHAEEYVAAIAGDMIAVVKCLGNEDWELVVDEGREMMVTDRGHYSAQSAADAAIEFIAEYLTNDAPVDEMIRLLGVHGQCRQSEIAVILGVSQPAVSGWMDGSSNMSRAVRTHLMRIAGIVRFQDRIDRPGKWIIQ